jgi:very-short-patch-repair endonuclease
LKRKPAVTPPFKEGRGGLTMYEKLGFTKTIPLRRKLRRDPTPAEKLFWSKVANRTFYGLKFVKQHGIGNYIVDFCCRSLNLIIEIDGDSHFTPEGLKSDQVRTKHLESFGYKIIRYNNLEVLNNIDGVFEDLKRQIDLLPTSSLKGGGQTKTTSLKNDSV